MNSPIVFLNRGKEESCLMSGCEKSRLAPERIRGILSRIVRIAYILKEVISKGNLCKIHLNKLIQKS